MKIGVISDTHNHFDPRLPDLFAGVDHILHAGDIGLPAVILSLERIAPVTAVLGNNDNSPQFKETEVITLDGIKFLVHHIVDVTKLSEPLRRRLDLENPHVVVFGHSHRKFNRRLDSILYFNPGYAGKPRFNEPRSIAILHCKGMEIQPEFIAL